MDFLYPLSILGVILFVYHGYRRRVFLALSTKTSQKSRVWHYTHATQNHFIYIFIVRAILPTILVQNLFVCVSKHKRFEVCFFVVVGWGDVEHLVWLRMYPIVIEHHESRFVSRRSDLQCGDFSTIHIYSSELGD